LPVEFVLNVNDAEFTKVAGPKASGRPAAAAGDDWWKTLLTRYRLSSYTTCTPLLPSTPSRAW
jgi:hypothetical protein